MQYLWIDYMWYQPYNTILLFAIEQMRVIQPLKTDAWGFAYKHEWLIEFKKTGVTFVNISHNCDFRVHMKYGNVVFYLYEIGQSLPFECLLGDFLDRRFLNDKQLFDLFADLKDYGMDHTVVVIDERGPKFTLTKIPAENLDPLIFKLTYL